MMILWLVVVAFHAYCVRTVGCNNVLRLLEKTENSKELPLYLDSSLWYAEETTKLVYNTTKHKLIAKNKKVFVFRYDNDVDDSTDTAADDDTDQDSGSRLSRRRRHLFGEDNRINISPSIVENFPFQSVVRLANGCTGTLIWYKHVLTSAHCVHDRHRYNPSVKELKVGLLRTDGTFQWIGARKVFVPNHWKKRKGSRNYANHDYAVIELKERHWRKSMAFGTHDVAADEMIQFTGYPSEKRPNQMWYSYCYIRVPTKHEFMNDCDATAGLSGSGVYIYKANERVTRKLVAVFSSGISSKNLNLRANVAIRLTKKKIKRICKWLKAGYNCSRISEWDYYD